ncbi:MAG TPA: prepilin-type N-terminal cleavage/methylation domain-containing protein [Candidatus Faecicola pullistercoris]|nr:prepilin-type N-terminal cleavage/methylation domain-containing protein [Candidatus Faecicola pullistercoris]
MLKKKLNKKGFSLIELIIVIAIMAILAAIIVPTVINKVQEANESAAQTEVSNIATAIQQEIVELQATTPAKELVYLKDDANGAISLVTTSSGDSRIALTPDTNPTTITITNTVGSTEYKATITISTGKVVYSWNSGGTEAVEGGAGGAGGAGAGA